MFEHPQQRRRYRLLSLDIELLPEPDSRAATVEVAQPQVERTLAPGARLEMEADEQQVEVGIVTGGAHSVDYLAQLVVFEGAPSVGQATRLLQIPSRAFGDESGTFGPSEEGTQRADAVLAS